jgi:hypothetical protein
MQLTVFNIPWLGRHPFRFALLSWFFAFAASSPAFVLALLPERQLWVVTIPVVFATVVALAYLSASLRMRSIVRHLDSLEGQVDEEYRAVCLVVKNLFSTPGIVAIAGGQLVLAPAFGASVELPLSELKSASEKRWFNGELLFGKAIGFWLTVPTFWRLGLAVENADAFRSVLERHAVQLG